MSLHLYNSLTRRVEPFVPADPARVTMYVCGPTVYNYVHIGNGRGPVVFGVLANVLRRRYGNLAYARNITDVDDKINTAAREQGVELVMQGWMAFLAPAGTPAPIIERVARDVNTVLARPDTVARLHAEVVKTLEQPDVKKRFADAGAELGGMSSADFAQRIRSDAARFKDIVQKANIRPE